MEFGENGSYRSYDTSEVVIPFLFRVVGSSLDPTSVGNQVRAEWRYASHDPLAFWLNFIGNKGQVAVSWALSRDNLVQVSSGANSNEGDVSFTWQEPVAAQKRRSLLLGLNPPCGSAVFQTPIKPLQAAIGQSVDIVPIGGYSELVAVHDDLGRALDAILPDHHQ